MIDRRASIADQARTLADGGQSVEAIKTDFEINDRFIERSVWSGREGPPRPPADFPGFDEFCESISVDDTFTVVDTIRSINRAGTESVYDIGVEHDAHNFVADGFVVSNCGV